MTKEIGWVNMGGKMMYDVSMCLCNWRLMRDFGLETEHLICLICKERYETD